MSEPQSVAVFVVEQSTGTDPGNDATEVVGVRFTLDAAKALGEAAYGSTDGWGGQREWLIDWRTGTESTLHDPVTLLNTWEGHRPAIATSRTAYLHVSITEHPIPTEGPTEETA